MAKMVENHLSNDEFFAQLPKLFDANGEKGHGSIYLHQKRYIHSTDADTPSTTKQLDDPLWDTHPEHPLPIVIRAMNSKSDKWDGPNRPGVMDRKESKKVKISTMVQPDQLDVFYARYAEVCKMSMTALKKRDRKKRKQKKRKAGEGEKKG
ncbi:signal recognition particle, SRP9/SRP14 subunit [Delitschia confertaspora ATCC 74209]|uniref:Signal recognition particle subunit SRP14 n=1 Tax=Delitschia confertaspora ATCC 74209 TaxID=1513339 RepID=A0A9P4JRI4_9PLEO|nr:signal recognition particle, SRP9/SRP14 subunit [Delitschia confertaspora ATCC 74209]